MPKYIILEENVNFILEIESWIKQVIDNEDTIINEIISTAV